MQFSFILCLGYFFTFASFTAIDPNLVFQLSGVSVLAYLIGYLSILTPSGFGVREGGISLCFIQNYVCKRRCFVSLFGRFILILAEVMYVFLSYAWH